MKLNNMNLISAADQILADYIDVTMFGSAQVQKILGRKDRASTLRIMRELMGAINDNGQWKVPRHRLAEYLNLRYGATPRDLARDILDRPRRSGKYNAAPKGIKVE